MCSLRLFLALTFLLLICGCGQDQPTTSTDVDGRATTVSPAPGSIREGAAFTRLPYEIQGQVVDPVWTSHESLLLAQWLVDEMYPPVTLAKELEKELKIIRERWSYQIGAVNIRFGPPYEVAMIVVGFTDDGWQMFREGEYHHWDALNEQFDLDTMILWGGGAAESFKNVELHFNRLPNANLLVDYYTGLPETKYVAVNGYCCDWPLLLVHQGDVQRHYFFRNAWGDCPSGCIEEEYFYFTVAGDSASYKGYYKPDWIDPLPRPDWMWMVDEALARYWVQNYWSPS
ncbi:MAG: hypothetical protein OEW00_11070 [candidate division Zixibacteria bacterium]|nr:hypothetical protein [candidate division Zixibacteria bacterium]